MTHGVHSSTPSADVILDVSHVWKAYCRNLKRAMWYGIKDLGRELLGRGIAKRPGELRPGEFMAVRDASFQVRPGECVAMIGPNGAGKSSMLKMINGLIKPNAGEIAIRGKIGALIELGTGFNPILSGRENVYINAAVLGMKKGEVDEVFDQIVDFAELGHVIDDPIKTYSSGMRVRLGFSVAANLRPQLLLIDEVLAVGDVGFRMKCFAHLRRLVEDGTSVILVTHAIGMLPRLANRSIVFGSGRVVHDGSLEAGCAMYEELLGVRERTREEKIQSGPLATKITSVETIDSTGQPCIEFLTGATIGLKIRIESQQFVPDARLIVALQSPVSGVLSSVSSPYQPFHFDLNPGDRTILIEFPCFPFLVGSYHFNISLYGPDITDFYHRVSGRGMFRVTGPPVDANGFGISGMVKVEHHWEDLG